MRDPGTTCRVRSGTFVEALERMESLLVTCPETGRPEQIGYLVARDGEPLVVLRCTRFTATEPMACSQACIACPDRGFVSRDPWRIPAGVPR